MELTHINSQGNARMVSVEEKEATLRVAVAKGEIQLSKDAFERVGKGGVKKGDVLAVAQIAGIMAAKKTSDFIPMCHPLNLLAADLAFELLEESCTIDITATVKVFGNTGVEMEALSAVSIAALTIYDMCKAMDKGMVIRNVYLLKKTGGKSGDYINASCK